MTDVSELIARLQKRYDSAEGSDMDCEAADALEAQGCRLADLEGALRIALNQDGDHSPTCECRLCEAVALLREIVAWRVAIECVAPELGGVATTLSRIDAFLAADSATHRETPVT